MNNIRGILAVGALGIALPSCANEAEILSDIAYFDKRLEVNINEKARIYQEFFNQNAPIQIIYVETEIPDSSASKSTTTPLESQIQNNDPKLIKSIEKSAANLTLGRYKPSSIDIVIAESLEVDKSCIERGNNQVLEAIDKHVEPVYRDDAINIVVIDQPVCEEEDIVLGFASPGYMPVLTGLVLENPDKFLETIIHETLHSAGVGHADVIACTDQTQPSEDCAEKPEADPTTTMGGLIGNFDTTASVPELLRAGILFKNEVRVNPDSGIYLVEAVDQKQDITNIKLLAITSDNNVYYFSWEQDLSLANGANILLDNPELNRSETYSLQVRLQKSGDVDLQLILRTDTSPDDPEFSTAIGEIDKNIVLFQDSDVELTFMGVTEKNQAIVRVTNK